MPCQLPYAKIEQLLPKVYNTRLFKVYKLYTPLLCCPAQRALPQALSHLDPVESLRSSWVIKIPFGTSICRQFRTNCPAFSWHFFYAHCRLGITKTFLFATVKIHVWSIWKCSTYYRVRITERQYPFNKQNGKL